MKKTTVSIAIDLDDEFEVKLLEHIKSKGNRSRYIKRLIHEDMMGVQKVVAPVVVQEDEDDKDAMLSVFD